MALPALEQAAEELSILPPTFRLEEAMALVADVQDFERVVAEAEAEAPRWRATMLGKMRTGFRTIKQATVGQDKAVTAAILLPMLDEAIRTLTEISAEFSTPFAEHPKVKEALEKFDSLGGAAARYFRRLVKRIEAIRAKYRSGYELAYFELLGFRAEFDPESIPADDTPELRTPEDLRAYFARLTSG